MTANLRHWERFADVDPKFTKPITGKDYSGTSPNPQYVIRCLTEIFGPVGEGFGWRVLADGFQPFGDTSLHWCRIEFWHTDRANTFEAYGQTKASYVTSTGKHRVDEDAPKKSLTDAITKAASHIGIAANIFLGRWDDSKYVDAVRAEYRAEEREQVNPFAARVPVALAAISKQADMSSLVEYWKALSRDEPAVARDAAVVKAKDARKAALSDPLAADEIPY